MVRQYLIVKCLRCKGSGEIENPDFERCIKEREPPYPDHVECRLCDHERGCKPGEFKECDDCQGRGEIHYNLEDFTYYIHLRPDPEILKEVFG